MTVHPVVTRTDAACATDVRRRPECGPEGGWAACGRPVGCLVSGHTRLALYFIPLRGPRSLSALLPASFVASSLQQLRHRAAEAQRIERASAEDQGLRILGNLFRTARPSRALADAGSALVVSVPPFSQVRRQEPAGPVVWSRGRSLRGGRRVNRRGAVTNFPRSIDPDQGGTLGACRGAPRGLVMGLASETPSELAISSGTPGRRFVIGLTPSPTQKGGPRYRGPPRCFDFKCRRLLE